jgi:hypothetical protein
METLLPLLQNVSPVQGRESARLFIFICFTATFPVPSAPPSSQSALKNCWNYLNISAGAMAPGEAGAQTLSPQTSRAYERQPVLPPPPQGLKSRIRRKTETSQHSGLGPLPHNVPLSRLQGPL